MNNVFIGEKTAETWKLKPQKRGYYTDEYDERVSAGVANSFATAAFRFIHSMVKVSNAFNVHYYDSNHLGIMGIVSLSG